MVILATGTMAAQETPEKVITRNGELLEAVFYHDNGMVAQEGTYKDGELHGEWTCYDKAGNKVAMGKYLKGKKVGKWFFWNQGQLSEVDFEDNRIADVKSWKVDNDLVSK